MKPLVNVAGTGLDSLNKALDNPATQKAVTQLGQGIANLSTKAAGMIDYLSAHSKDITSITSSVVSIAKVIGQTIWQSFVNIVSDISKAFGNLQNNTKGSKDPLDRLSSALSAIASHKEAIANLTKIFLGFLVTKKVLEFTSSLVGLGKHMIFKPTIDPETGKKQLTLFSRAIKGTVSAIGKSLKWTASIAYSGAKKSVALLWSGIKGTGNLIGKSLKWTAQVAVKGAQLAMAGLLKTAKITGTGLKLAFNFLKANPFILIVTAIAAVVAALIGLYKHNAKFRAFVNGLIKAAQDCWKNVVKFFKALWKDTVGIVTSLYKDVTGWFGNMKKGISDHVSNIWKSTKNGFKDGWNTVKGWTSDGASKVSDGFSNMKKWTISHVQDMWKTNKGTFKDGYKVTQDYTQTWHDIMTGKWSKVGSDLKNTAKDLTTFWRNIFKGVYDWLNNITGGRLGDVLNIFKSIFGKIKDVVSGAIDAVHHSFVGIVRGIIKPFNSLLSGLKKGINWILDKVGMSKIKASWDIPLPAYAQGTKDTHQGGLALVNDGQGANYREMYKLPNGKVGMFPAIRNMVVPLPKGASVLDGDNSLRLAQALGLPKYASGIGSFFSGIWDKGKDLLEDADKIIAHPIDFLSGVFDKMVGGLSSKIELAQDLITGLPKTIASGAIKWVKSLFDGDAGGGKGAPSGSGVQRWKGQVIEALSANGLSTSSDMVNKVLRQIQTESGGNEKAVQGGYTDVNTLSGDLAKGLMQTISATFNAYKFPGHGNIFNGYDNLLAALNYAKHAYGSNLSALGNGHGYANGGAVSAEGLYTLAEGNKTEYVIPTDLNKHNRAVQLLDEAKAAVGVNDDSSESSDTLNRLNDKFDTLLDIFGQLLGLSGAQLSAIKAGNDPTKLYQRMAMDQNAKNYQTFGG
ncbi:MAG: transglycosylase SLT domain-containing protein [Liquorilactobacillus satsumensis]